MPVYDVTRVIYPNLSRNNVMKETVSRAESSYTIYTR